MNRFVLNETSYHGAGAIAAIATEIQARGFKKAWGRSYQSPPNGSGRAEIVIDCYNYIKSPHNQYIYHLVNGKNIISLSQNTKQTNI